MNDDGRGRSAASTAAMDAGPDLTVADAAFGAIGYEAADPSLLGPFWGEDLPTQGRLR